MLCRIAAWLASLLCLGTALAAETAPSLRRPVDAEWIVPGRILVTANSRSGSLSFVDLAADRTVHEEPIGGQPVDLLRIGDHQLAMIDAERNQLRRLRIDPANWKVEIDATVPTRRGPNSLIAIAPGLVSVSSLWDRSLERLAIEGDEAAIEASRMNIELSFAPRCQLVLPGGEKLLVADNHAGHLAIIDIETWTIGAIRTLNAHNIRGLAISSDEQSLLVAHQILNQQVTTGLDAVRDGTLMQNVIRIVPLEKLFDPQALLPVHARTIFLGRPPDGASDPADLVLDAKNNLCVSLGGVDQLAVVTSKGLERRRPRVGRRPTRILPVPDRAEVVVVNTFSDSVSLIDSDKARVRREIQLGPMRELTKAERGELLFYDGRLSFENWMSCQSCHTDGHANGLLADTLGDGTANTPKRVLTLLGGRDANPWAWNGESRELHDQVIKSVKNTMHGKPLPFTQVTDIVSYLHSLPPAPPLNPATDDPADQELVARGQQVFQDAGCVRCHVPPLTYTSDTTYDVQIHDEAGHKLFNPPSLRGVSQRDSYFHDARVKSLEEVLEQGHFTQKTLTPEERTALLRFLRSL